MSEHNDLNIIENTPDTAYFSISVTKLRYMYLLTFGLYCIYWFYKHWKLQNLYSMPQVMPVMRAIFAIFFTHSLAHRIKLSMDRNNIEGTKYLSLLATAFVVLIVLSNVFSNLASSEDYPDYFHFIWLALFYLSWIPLGEIQDKINTLKGDPLGSVNSKYNWQNITIMIIGGVLWFFVLMGLLFMALGITQE